MQVCGLKLSGCQSRAHHPYCGRHPLTSRSWRRCGGRVGSTRAPRRSPSRLRPIRGWWALARRPRPRCCGPSRPWASGSWAGTHSLLRPARPCACRRGRSCRTPTMPRRWRSAARDPHRAAPARGAWAGSDAAARLQHAVVAADGTPGPARDRALRRPQLRGPGRNLRGDGGPAPALAGSRSLRTSRTSAAPWRWACPTSSSPTSPCWAASGVPSASSAPARRWGWASGATRATPASAPPLTSTSRPPCPGSPSPASRCSAGRSAT